MIASSSAMTTRRGGAAHEEQPSDRPRLTIRIRVGDDVARSPRSPIGRGSGLKIRPVWVRIPPGAPSAPRGPRPQPRVPLLLVEHPRQHPVDERRRLIRRELLGQLDGLVDGHAGRARRRRAAPRCPAAGPYGRPPASGPSASPCEQAPMTASIAGLLVDHTLDQGHRVLVDRRLALGHPLRQRRRAGPPRAARTRRGRRAPASGPCSVQLTGCSARDAAEVGAVARVDLDLLALGDEQRDLRSRHRSRGSPASCRRWSGRPAGRARCR